MKNIYIGTYTKALYPGHHASGKGISHCRFCESGGSITMERIFSESENPSYVCLSEDGKYLAACNEKASDCAVDLYQVNADGSLEFISRRVIRGIACCHVAFSPDNHFVVASNYMNGSVVTVPIGPDGNLEEVSSDIQLEGSGPNKLRQERSHAHSARFIPALGLLLVCDLGSDKIMLYRYNEKGVLYPHMPAFVETPGGSGPRHMEVSADNRFLYVTCELSCETAVFVLESGIPVLKQMITTVAKGMDKQDLAADIHLSADGQYLYVSTRGKDILTQYRVNADGTLGLENTFSSGGSSPRHFQIVNNWLLCGNQDSDNIAVFRVCEDGQLLMIANDFSIAAPTCIGI